MITSADPVAGGWTVTNLVGGFVSINDVDCPSTTLCVAVDSAGSVWWSTNPSGGAWTSEPVFGSGLQDVDCPSTTLCVVTTGSAGSIFWSTVPTGVGTWTQAVIDGVNAEFSLSCPSTTLCVTGNDQGDIHWTNTPTGLAASWTAVPGVDTGAVIQGMSCATTTLCVGVDDSGNVVTTTNPTGGVGAWTVTNIAGGGLIYNVSCPDTALCVTGAGSTAYTSDNPTGGALTWATDALASTLRAISCPTTALCVAGGNSGNLYIGVQPTVSVALAGTGSGTVASPDFTCPLTCAFVYPINTQTTLTATPASDGSTFSGWSGDCSGTLACNLTMASNRQVTATFTAPAHPVAGPASTPPDPPPAGPSAELPPPTAQKTANVYPTSGTVQVKPPGTKTFVPLARAEQVGFGTVFDTRKGVVRIVIANARGGLDEVVVSEGQFRLVAAGGLAELQLVGGNFKGCPKAAKGGAAAAGATRGRNVRHLWANGSGSFRTKGRYASATIRGTKWLTDDYCRGTLLKVALGAVTVRDLVKRKSVSLKSPKTYFARPKS